MAYKMKGYSYAGKSPLKQKGHSKGTYETSMKEHAKENPYWYKVNGKRVSKHVYNKYENKPGGDEIGKQTNDPDASGNKAKIAKDRASRDWKPAYEGGDYSKEDLRKMTPKQRKKIEKGQE